MSLLLPGVSLLNHISKVVGLNLTPAHQLFLVLEFRQIHCHLPTVPKFYTLANYSIQMSNTLHNTLRILTISLTYSKSTPGIFLNSHFGNVDTDWIRILKYINVQQKNFIHKLTYRCNLLDYKEAISQALQSGDKR